MQNKLRKKFIVATTSITVITLLLITVLINTFNYYSIISDANYIVDLLLENNLQLQENLTNKTPKKLPQEISFTTRYFVAKTDNDGVIHFVDIQNISSVDLDQAKQYTEDVYAMNSERGTINNYQYIKLENESSITFVFLDIEAELLSFHSFCLYSIIISLVAIIIIFILSCIFSKSVVAPIVNSYIRQQRFITDVSHEFKTPLAIIQADNDVMEIDYGKSEWTTSVKAQITRLNFLINNLLTLTALDEEGDTIEKNKFSLSNLLNEILNDFTPSIKQLHLKLNTSVDEDVFYYGEVQSIGRLFNLVIENAIKYANEQSEIYVHLHQQANRITFTIENHANGITPGKKEEWFDRFYREEPSRSSTKKGHGIGLSIAKSICDKHKIKISAECDEKQKVKISMQF